MLRKYLLVCAVCVITASDDVKTNSSLLRIEVADGFPLETHNVITTDGYILQMHRIPHGRDTASIVADRPVVFLMHGLMSSSNTFVGLGPELSFAYNLADADFDVWLGNARGNVYSRSHTNLDPDDDTEKFEFFDFTFEEIGLHDLPTMMDYILEVTGKEKLHYIGHSQGGTVFLVLGSLRPEYNAKIASAHLLAAVGYQEYFPDATLAAAAANTDVTYSIALQMGIVELYPDLLDFLTPEEGYTKADYCTGNLKLRFMCEIFGIRHILGENTSRNVNPAGASLKQAAHYGQNIRDKLFRRYHFGTDNNMILYGQEEPPLYDIGVITADVTMHYTLSDHLLDERDVLAMAADMPNTIVRKVERETFLHSDFVAASDAKELVTDYIIEAIMNTPDTGDETGTDTTDVDSVIVVDETTAAPANTDSPDDASTEVTTEAPDDDSGSPASTMLNIYLIFFTIMLIIK